nr:hypothetical protein [Gandjariella thermophila]
MVLAISFVEAPLKFRAPGVTIPLGLGIGRIVFRALNRIEAMLAVAVVGVLAAAHPAVGVLCATAVVVVVLAGQLAVIRPRLNRRSDRVLAEGDTGQRSSDHLVYVATELVKVAGLLALGVLALTG